MKTVRPLSVLNPIFTLPSRAIVARWAPIPLRLIVGFGFLQHGYAKLSRGPEVFAAVLHALGVPNPHLMAWLIILVEVIGGIAILFGAFVALASIPMAAVLIVAIFSVHLPYGFSSIKLVSITAGHPNFGPPGYECALLYLACLAALVIGGPGPLAVDNAIRRILAQASVRAAATRASELQISQSRS